MVQNVVINKGNIPFLKVFCLKHCLEGAILERANSCTNQTLTLF